MTKFITALSAAAFLLVASVANAQQKIAAVPEPVAASSAPTIGKLLVGKECRGYFDYAAHSPDDSAKGALWLRYHNTKGWGLWATNGSYAKSHWEEYSSYTKHSLGPRALVVASDGPQSLVLDFPNRFRYTLTSTGGLDFDLQITSVGELWRGKFRCF